MNSHFIQFQFQFQFHFGISIIVRYGRLCSWNAACVFDMISAERLSESNRTTERERIRAKFQFIDSMAVFFFSHSPSLSLCLSLQTLFYRPFDCVIYFLIQNIPPKKRASLCGRLYFLLVWTLTKWMHQTKSMQMKCRFCVFSIANIMTIRAHTICYFG